MDRDVPALVRMAAALSREQRVLLVSARLPDDAEARARLDDAIGDGLDWAAVVVRAHEEGTASLLHAHLARHPDLAARVPGDIRARLARADGLTWARTIALTERWREAMQTLHASTIPALTLKGMALVHTCYPSPALRPMADIDLLVRPEHAMRAIEGLAAVGYRAVAADGDHRYRHLTRNGTVIDLHWSLADYPRVARVLAVDHAGVWRRARAFTADGGEGLTLGPEDCVLFLALHLTLGSEFGRLIWFTDIAAALSRFGQTFDWSAAVEEARRWRIAGVLGHTLGIARASFGADVPPVVIEALLPSGTRRTLAGWLVGNRIPPSVAGSVSAPRAYLAETALLDSGADIARAIATTLFPPSTWIRAHYGVTGRRRVALWRLGHVLRVGLLAARAGFRRRLPSAPSPSTRPP